MTTSKGIRKEKRSIILNTNNFVNNCRVFDKTVRAEFRVSFQKILPNLSFLEYTQFKEML